MRCNVRVLSGLVLLCLLFTLAWKTFRDGDSGAKLAIDRELLHGHYELMVGIVSAPSHFRERAAARRTWLRYANNVPRGRVAHRFFVGRVATSTTMSNVSAHWLARQLAEEQSAHGDLVALDSLDSYERLPFKTLAMFRWLAAQHGRNCSFDFVLKTDDDSYVRIERLLAHLRAAAALHDDLYWGFFNYGAVKTRVPDGDDAVSHSQQRVQRDIKWSDPEFNGTHYPPYALGAGYALSMSLVARVVRHTVVLAAPPSRMEDAATGIYLDSHRYL